MTAGKAIRRADGSAVLDCESGNPQLGVVVTPEARGVIVCLPGGPHPLDSVAVRLGHQQCAVLAELATGAEATPTARDGSNGDESVEALEQQLERSYQARRGALFDRENGWGWCVGCGRNPVCAKDGNDTCPTCLESC
jgi:hypothetical protein